MNIRSLFLKLILGKKSSSTSYIKHLRNKGAYVGKNTHFFSPHQISIDEQYPWLIEIGDNVQLTAGVRILTHDYSWAVLKKVYGPILGSAGKVKIGNNVFIGSNTLILGGTSIGNNVIIGAGSVVKGKIPDNCVAVGNPCKPIESLQTYYEKRTQRQLIEAKTLAQAYYLHTGKVPSKELFYEFFFLFENPDNLSKEFKNQMSLVGNFDKSIEYLKNKNRLFSSYQEFIKEVLNE